MKLPGSGAEIRGAGRAEPVESEKVRCGGDGALLLGMKEITSSSIDGVGSGVGSADVGFDCSGLSNRVSDAIRFPGEGRIGAMGIGT